MASAYLQKQITATNTTAITFSAWIKRSKIGYDAAGVFQTENNSSDYLSLVFNASDQIDFQITGTQNRRITNRVFRDTNAWYHLLVAVDSSQGSAGNRIKIYINGVQETSFATETNNMAQDSNLSPIDATLNYAVGYYPGQNTNYFDGQMAHVHYVVGTAYAPSTFGETDTTTGIWKPKVSPSGVNYGSKGFFLKFDNSASMGLDSSGLTNNLTVSGTIIQTKDTPSNVFATGNPLSSRHPVLTSTNNNIFFDETGQWRAVYSTLGASSGKYYMEAKVDAVGGEASIGVIPAEIAAQNQDTGDYLGKETDSIGYLNNGRTFKSNSQLQTGLTSMSSGTIVGVALDLDNNTVQFYNNNSAVGNAIATTAGTIYLFGFSGYSDTRFYANFGNGYFNTSAVASAENPDDGNGIFEYDPPSGFRALSTKSLNAEEYS